MKLKKLTEQTLVITGASSGIGLTTARAAVREGARVVVASRDETALRQLVDELGSERAAYALADVANPDQVRHIRDVAEERFGGFDTWVNNAGASVYGRILEVPVEDERRLFETNYWGTVYGSRVAAEYLRTHGGGALINLGSVASDTAIPLQAAYSASKHAIKAYTDILRVELEKEGAPVSVTLIKPTAINTPFFEHAKTYLGVQPIGPGPLYTPEDVAQAILYAACNPVRDLLVGDLAPLQSAAGRMAPAVGDAFGKAVLFDAQKSSRSGQPGDNQGLDRPARNLRERGDYPERTTMPSLYTRARVHPLLTGALAAGAGLALGALWLGRGTRSAGRY